MKYLVTGATGFIGNALVLELARQGHLVYALYRNESKRSLLAHQNIFPVQGDIDNLVDINGLPDVLDGIFHLAAFVSIWPPDRTRYFRLNAEVVRDLLELGRRHSVRRIVFTSSAGVLGPVTDTGTLNEDSERTVPFFNDYESSKSEGEKLFFSLDAGQIERVILQPTRVYGPGILSESNAVTSMILGHARGKWRIIPGRGNKVGNYVFIDAVIRAHIAAMEIGGDHRRYIVGGENLSFNQLFRILTELHGRRVSMIRVPLWMMLRAAGLIEFLGRLGLIWPRITPPWVRKYLHDYHLSSARAEKELGMPFISFREGAKLTLEWAGLLNRQSGGGK